MLAHVGYARRYMWRAGVDASMTLARFGDKIERVLRAVVDKGKGLEINCSGIRDGCGPFPSEEILRLYRALGGEIVWPCATREITAEGVICEDGRFFPAGDVIVAVGETPDLSFLPEGAPMFRAWLAPGAGQQILEGVFAAGDCIKPGLIASAIGSGNRAADAWLRGQPYAPKEGCAAAKDRLHVEWFAKFRKEDLPRPKDDHVRCISCGSCRDCGTCLECCPEGAISRKALPGGGFEYVSDPERCIGCGMCQGVCPCGVWTMRPNAPLAQ